jgi:hypothetical protein
MRARSCPLPHQRERVHDRTGPHLEVEGVEATQHRLAVRPARGRELAVRGPLARHRIRRPSQSPRAGAAVGLVDQRQPPAEIGGLAARCRSATGLNVALRRVAGVDRSQVPAPLDPMLVGGGWGILRNPLFRPRSANDFQLRLGSDELNLDATAGRGIALGDGVASALGLDAVGGYAL